MRRGRPDLPRNGRSRIERRALPQPDQEGFPGVRVANVAHGAAVAERSTCAKCGEPICRLPAERLSMEPSRRRVRALTMIVCRCLGASAFSAPIIP